MSMKKFFAEWDKKTQQIRYIAWAKQTKELFAIQANRNIEIANGQRKAATITTTGA